MSSGSRRRWLEANIQLGSVISDIMGGERSSDDRGDDQGVSPSHVKLAELAGKGIKATPEGTLRCVAWAADGFNTAFSSSLAPKAMGWAG